MCTWTPPNAESAPPKPGEPPLHAAARTGDHIAIRRCVDGGADIDAVFDIGLGSRDCRTPDQPVTPLMVAAGSGDGATVHTVKLLLELGADPTRVAGRNSAATMACVGLGWNYKPGGDADRLRLLLEKGAPLPPNPSLANRVLCDTARSGDGERLGLLVQHGLPANGYWDPEEAREIHRRSMEDIAAFRASEPDMFEGMPEELRDAMSASMEAEDLRMFERLSSAPSSFELPLFCAAESGDADCVRVLLEAGAALDTRDSFQQTAMYYAASDAVVRALLEAGLPIEDGNTYGWSPLESAVHDGEVGFAVIKALLANGADVNATHDRGYTVFMSAVSDLDRSITVMRTLVEAGADPHAVTELGYNAFHAAIDVDGEANDEVSVRSTLGYLKELGVDIEHRNNAGQTPLARAIDHGKGTEVRVLCELGANPDAVCSMHQCGEDACGAVGMPVLFAAADGIGVDKDEKVSALLDAGADPLVTDTEGFTTMMRVVAALCADADDYTTAYKRFFAELSELSFDEDSVLQDRMAFVENAMPALDEFIRRFAAIIPVKETCEFDAEWREERIKCLALLAAHEGWARCQPR